MDVLCKSVLCQRTSVVRVWAYFAKVYGCSMGTGVLAKDGTCHFNESAAGRKTAGSPS